MDVFNEEPTGNPLETLVGEGKKYASVDELAKAYMNADRFINQLKTESTQLREELTTRLTVEEQLKALREREPVAPIENKQPLESRPAINEDDLVDRIREVTAKEREREQREQNLGQVISKLEEVFGGTEKANQVIRLKAQELGVTVDFLKDAAMKSPTGFFRLVGVEAETRGVPTSPKSDVNTAALQNKPQSSKPGTWGYYEALRRENPRLYLSPKIQNQIMQDRAEKGESFYS